MQKKRIAHALVVVEIIILFVVAFLFLMNQNPKILGFTIYQSSSDGLDINDTYLRNDFPNNNFGTGTILRVGETSANVKYRSVIRDLNITSITSEDSIADAKLQFYVEEFVGNSNITISAHRITQQWDESITTWNRRTSGFLWYSSGGDYDSTPINSINISTQTGIYYNITITNLVKGWLNGSYSNYGLILIATGAPGNYSGISSSEHTTPAQRPIFIVDHQSNVIPTITDVTTNSSLTSPINVGDLVNITVNWTDIESDTAQLFVCNTSSINKTGCQNTTLCSASSQEEGPSSCTYTIQSSDNRTRTFYSAICDLYNCSTINQSYFYTNHYPLITIISPNGGETINQSQGNYLIVFNSTDTDEDLTTANIYYGTSSGSTTNTIATNVNLTHNCTDIDMDPQTPNYCTYSWNSSGVYGNYYLTIIVNDSYSLTNDSSDSTFNAISLIDDTAPNITAQWITSNITSGESVYIYANVTEENINTVWVSINGTTNINLTMTNSSSTEYNRSWIASTPGSYQFKIYANDTIGNLNNSMAWESFTISIPNATSQGEQAPSSALPFHTIKITAQLNATDPLREVYAYLNTPSGFTFVSNYSQNNLLGNFTYNQTKTATWFLSVPITEATYSLNITYSDYYSNSWNSSNMEVQVSSSGSGATYFVSLAGSPEVVTQSDYYVESYFTSSGIYSSPDSMGIIILDAGGSQIVGPTAMTSETSAGIYNYTYTVGASATEGIWETIVNATKSSTSYYAHEFWKVTGGPFDVRTITIVNSDISALNISVILENTGGANKDMTLNWNLTRTDTDAILDSGSETIMVTANSEKLWSVNPTTTYVGSVKITFIGYYGPSFSEKAGAYTTFTTTSGGMYCGDGTCNNGETCATCSADCGACPTTPSGGGGGGGGSTTTPIAPTKASLTIETDTEIYLAKNIEKTIKLKIKNTGTETINNLNLLINNLDSDYYTITPTKISSLKSGETNEFKINLIVTDFIGEKEFEFLVQSDETSAKKSAKLIVTTMKEFFIKEIERLKNRIKGIKDKTSEEKLLTELKECESIVNQLENNVEKEEFINAKDNLKKSDLCIDDVENQIKEETPAFKMNYLIIILIFVILLVLILIAAVIAIVYILNKKLTLLSFAKEKEQKNKSNPKIKKDTSLSTQSFDEKLKQIERKINS